MTCSSDNNDNISLPLPPSGTRSPSPSCVTSCGSSTRRRTSSGRQWFAGMRRTARDCRRRCGSTERLLRGFASSEQDYCPLVGWRKWLGFFGGVFSSLWGSRWLTGRNVGAEGEEAVVVWKDGRHSEAKGWFKASGGEKKSKVTCK